jgi:hypothetical protein
VCGEDFAPPPIADDGPIFSDPDCRAPDGAVVAPSRLRGFQTVGAGNIFTIRLCRAFTVFATEAEGLVVGATMGAADAWQGPLA